MKILLSLNEIGKIIKPLKSEIKKKQNDVIVILRGDLASGKTTLVKEFVKSLNISDLVTSPTFSIQSKYGENIYHYDVYNKSLDEFIALGLLEEFDKSGIHFVEWGDEKLENILVSYGYNVIILQIHKENNKRLYIINE